MRLKVFSVDHNPPELEEHVPFKVTLLRRMAGPEPRPDSWLGELDRPIRWLNKGESVRIDHLIVWPRWQGTLIAPDVRHLPIGIAYVTDPSLLAEETADPSKYAYVAIGSAHEISGGSSSKPTNWGRFGIILSVILDGLGRRRT